MQGFLSNIVCLRCRHKEPKKAMCARLSRLCSSIIFAEQGFRLFRDYIHSHSLSVSPCDLTFSFFVLLVSLWAV